MSHDINSDPEVWELTDQFGDRGLRAWLECLSIADRNEGLIPGQQERIERAFSIKLNTLQTKVKRLFEWFEERSWLIRDPLLRVRNYSTYKYSKAGKKKPKRSPPNITSHHITKNPKKDSSQPPPTEALECAQLLSDKIFENFPNRTAPTEAQLTAWARDAEKIHRLDAHPWPEINEVIQWAAADTFWRANILSMGKLREKWNQLVAKKESSDGRNSQAEPKGFATIRQILRKNQA